MFVYARTFSIVSQKVLILGSDWHVFTGGHTTVFLSHRGQIFQILTIKKPEGDILLQLKEMANEFSAEQIAGKLSNLVTKRLKSPFRIQGCVRALRSNWRRNYSILRVCRFGTVFRVQSPWFTCQSSPWWWRWRKSRHCHWHDDKINLLRGLFANSLGNFTGWRARRLRGFLGGPQGKILGYCHTIYWPSGITKVIPKLYI